MADGLARHRGTLVLNGLTTLSDEAAGVLAQREGKIHLDGLTGLTHAALAAKLVREHAALNLNSLTSLSDEAAGALAQNDGTLNKELRLDGLKTLSTAAARALAGYDRNTLSLRGLTTLSAETARALAEFKGRVLSLQGLTTLDADTAQALAAAAQWDGELPKLTAVDFPDSVAIAKALATRQGLLSLPNLDKISPKTLAALIEKRDVEMPPIEKLELIQEPDGSITEDFVIPDWLEQRQQAGGHGLRARALLDSGHRQKLLGKFDTDGDGKLSASERAAAKEARARAEWDR